MEIASKEKEMIGEYCSSEGMKDIIFSQVSKSS